MKNNKEVIKQFENHYKITKSGNKNQWRHIQECQAFYAGDYMNYRDEAAFGRGSSRRIKEVQFNRVKPYVNSIVGFMAQQRAKPDYQAKNPDKEEQIALSEYLNGFSDYVRENNNAAQAETQQDKDFIIGGIGATDTGITLEDGFPTRDPNGEILTERVDPLHCGWDPDAKDTNILSSRWVYRAKDYDVEEAKILLDADDEDFEYADQEDSITDYEFNPFGGIQDKIGFEWADADRQMVRVYFYQWYEIENFYRIENPMIEVQDPELQLQLANALVGVEVNEEDELFAFDPKSRMLVMTKENRKDIKAIFEQYGIKFNPITEKRKVFYTAVLSGDKVFSKYKSPSQQGFTLKFKTGDRDEVNKIWTGIVASMREPQRYYNKSLTELLLIIANNSRGGVLYEESAVDNVQEFEASWAKFNTAVRVNDGALSGGKIQPKAVPHMNSGYEGILETSSMAMGQVTGIDESFFGAIAGGNETAMLQRQRIKQATTTLACFFDSITLYGKEQARMMLSFMRLLAASSDGKLFSAFDEEGGIVFERITLDFFADEYEIMIGESPETPMQKEYYTQTLLSMAQSMQAIGDPRYKQMYAAAVKYMPIPQRDKTAIIEVLLGEEQIDPQVVEQLQQQIQQMQGEQVQLANARIMADIEKTRAETDNTLATIQKTGVDIEETHEDIEKKAIENDLMALQSPDDVSVTI